jgi:hypothetical protein
MDESSSYFIQQHPDPVDSEMDNYEAKLNELDEMIDQNGLKPN